MNWLYRLLGCTPPPFKKGDAVRIKSSGIFNGTQGVVMRVGHDYAMVGLTTGAFRHHGDHMFIFDELEIDPEFTR